MLPRCLLGGALIALAPIAAATAAPAAGPVLAITGATLVDVSDRGRAGHDIPGAVVLIQDGRILAAGPAVTTPVPPGATILARPGKFLIPGLVDGFTGLQNQAEANAELYEGVTTIVGSGDDRRGHLFEHANPSPHLYALDSAGSTDDFSLLRDQPAWRDKLADGDKPHELTPEETTQQLQATARRGTRAIWIGHNITQANTAAIISQSRRLGMVTYGEFVATPYQSAIENGVDALLHMSRYELGLAPAQFVAPLASAPEGREANDAYAAAITQPADGPAVREYAKLLAQSGTALIPTFSLFYTSLPDHRNLWKEKVASIIDPHTLILNSDPDTGDMDVTPAKETTFERGTQLLWAINGTIMAAKPIYLAASGASTLGALPGIALHVELELLVRRGLTPRQALAAATSNYADKFGWRELGEIVPGRRADVVVLDADPTADIRNADRISDVVLGGGVIDRAKLLAKQNL
jgi:hypothetical protein